jgi:hypothetical protein
MHVCVYPIAFGMCAVCVFEVICIESWVHLDEGPHIMALARLS